MAHAPYSLPARPPSLEVADVHWANIAAMEAYLKMVAEQRGGNYAQLIDRLYSTLPSGWDRNRIKRVRWMPLPIYSTIERQLARILGNPACLVEAAQHGAAKSGFGERYNVADAFMMGLYSFLSPRFFYSNVVPPASGLYNRNKDTVVVADSPVSVTYRITYRQVNGERIREPRDDMGSLWMWAPGFTSAPAYNWGAFATIQRIQVELDLRWLFDDNREFIKEDYEIRSDGFYVAGQRVAEPIWLTMDNDGYLTILSTRPTEYMGWRVLGDITVTTPSGEKWLLAKKGEIYAPEGGCSLFRYDWIKRGTLLSPRFWAAIFNSLRAGRRLFDAQAGFSHRLHEAEVEVEDEQRRLDEERQRRQQYPDPRIMRILDAGGSAEIHDPVVLVYDVAGWSAASQAWGDRAVREILEPFQAAYTAAIAPYRPTNWEIDPPENMPIAFVINEEGDKVLIAFYNASLDVLGNIALTVAEQVHAAVRGIPSPTGGTMRGRCGIGSIPRSIMIVRRGEGKPHASAGPAIDLGARCEEAGKHSRIAPSLDVPVTVLPQWLSDAVGDRYLQPRLQCGAINLKNIGEVPLVRMVDDAELG